MEKSKIFAEVGKNFKHLIENYNKELKKPWILKRRPLVSPELGFRSTRSRQLKNQKLNLKKKYSPKIVPIKPYKGKFNDLLIKSSNSFTIKQKHSQITKSSNRNSVVKSPNHLMTLPENFCFKGIPYSGSNKYEFIRKTKTPVPISRKTEKNVKPVNYFVERSAETFSAHSDIFQPQSLPQILKVRFIYK